MSINLRVEHNGVSYNAEIMTISRTSLGDESHGIFTAYLELSGEASGVNLGGYDLRNAYCSAQIKGILSTLSKERWEQLPRTECIVLFEGQRAIGIASLRGDRVMVFEEHLNEWKAAQAK